MKRPGLFALIVACTLGGWAVPPAHADFFVYEECSFPATATVAYHTPVTMVAAPTLTVYRSRYRPILGGHVTRIHTFGPSFGVAPLWW